MVPPIDKSKLLDAFFALIFTNKVSQAWVLSDLVWGGELPAVDMGQVKDYFGEIGPYESRGLDGLYPNMLRKQVIQYLFTVFCKGNLCLKVSRMIDDAYVHRKVYIHLYVHTVFSKQNDVSYFTNSLKVLSVGFFLPQTCFYQFLIIYSCM